MITTIDQQTALVLIDLQKGIAGLPLAHPVKDVLDRAAILVAAFRKANLPVVIVNVKPSGSTTRKDSNPVFNMAEDFADIVEEIKTAASDIFITKHTWNAFYNTALHEELQKRKVTGIVIAGISTSFGVEGTARAAAERGYNISFATDAMTDMKEAAHDNSIRNIFPRLGEVGTMADIAGKLEERK